MFYLVNHKLPVFYLFLKDGPSLLITYTRGEREKRLIPSFLFFNIFEAIS